MASSVFVYQTLLVFLLRANSMQTNRILLKAFICGSLTLSLDAMVPRTTKRLIQQDTDMTAISQSNRHQNALLRTSTDDEGSSQTNNERIAEVSFKRNAGGNQIKSRVERGKVRPHANAQLSSTGQGVSVEVASGSNTRGKPKVGILRDDPVTTASRKPLRHPTKIPNFEITEVDTKGSHSSNGNRPGVLRDESNSKAHSTRQSVSVEETSGSRARGKGKAGSSTDDPETVPGGYKFFHVHSDGRPADFAGPVDGLMYTYGTRQGTVGDQMKPKPPAPPVKKKKIPVARPTPTKSAASKAFSWMKSLFKKTPPRDKQQHPAKPIDLNVIRPNDDPDVAALTKAKKDEFYNRLYPGMFKNGGHE